MRRELAMAAVRLYEEKGFAATTVEEIARAADYSPSTFFRHFPKKEDVVFYDIPGMVESLRQRLAESEGASAWEVVRNAFLSFAVEFEEADPELAVIRARLLLQEPELSARYAEICQVAEDLIAAAFAAERGVDPQTDLYCRTVAGAIMVADRAAMRAQQAQGGRFVDHVAAAFDLLEEGLQPGKRLRAMKAKPS
jgi:AcrR family transcriptional regulator